MMIKKGIVSLIFSLGTGVILAQDYENPAPTPATDGGTEAVITAQDSPPPSPQPVKPVEEQLKDWATSDGRDFANFTWDPEKNRTLKIKTAGANIGPSQMGDFTQIRESLYVEAELSAKAEIIESFLTTASAENLLSIPGNPIAKQLEKEQREFKEAKAKQEQFFMQAREEAAKLLSAIDEAEADELNGVGYGDRLKSLLDASIKKIDEGYSTESLTAEKQKRVKNLKRRVQRAKEYEAVAATKWKEIEEKVAAFQGKIKQEQRSRIATISEMPLFGAVTLAQAESYDELGGNYELAIIMAWSPKLELESRSILMGTSELKPRPNKKSFKDWLDSLDLSVMVGSRRYLPSDGSINFVGISAVEYDPDDSSAIGDAQMEAGLWAKQYAILSLTGDVSSQKAAERRRNTVRKADGNTGEKVYKNMSAEIIDSVEGLSIRGLDIVLTKRVVHPASGKHMMVAVASVNSDLATKSSNIMKETYATLKELNESQSYRAGEIEGMKAAAAASKNNTETRKAGFNEGNSSVQSEYISRQPKQQQAVGSESKSTQYSQPSNASAGSVQSGTFMGGVDDVDDDF